MLQPLFLKFKITNQHTQWNANKQGTFTQNQKAPFIIRLSRILSATVKMPCLPTSVAQQFLEEHLHLMLEEQLHANVLGTNMKQNGVCPHRARSSKEYDKLSRPTASKTAGRLSLVIPPI